MPIQSALGALSTRGFGLGTQTTPIPPITFYGYILQGIVYSGSKYIAVGQTYNTTTYEYYPYVLESSDSNSWEETTSIEGQSKYQAIAYNGSNYSLAGFDTTNTMFVNSSDGTTFTKVSSITFTNEIKRNIWGNDEFVVISNSNEIYRSADGVTWTQSTVNPSSNYELNDIIWDGTNYFVTVTNQVGGINYLLVLSSPDLITWTNHPLAGGNVSHGCIAYSGTDYVIVAKYVNQSLVSYTSTDGITWADHYITPVINPATPYSVIYENEQFIAVGTQASSEQYGLIVTSSDGINWTKQAVYQFANTQFNQIIWDGSQYISVGYVLDPITFIEQAFIVTSTNGSLWYEKYPNNYTYFRLFGVSKKDSDYLAVGKKYNNYYSTFYTLKSSDGITWSEIYTIPPSENSQYVSIASSSTNYSLIGYSDVIGQQNIFVYSTNGINFTETDNISSLSYKYSIVYGDKFVLVRDNTVGFISDIITSDDGTTWNTTPSNILMDVQNIIWTGTQYIVCGLYNLGAAIATSSDGINWSSIQSVYVPPGSNMGSAIIAYSGSEYVITGLEYGTPNNIISLVSTDLINWTRYVAVSNSGAKDPYCIIYENSQYIAVGDPNIILTSPDGQTWTQQDTSAYTNASYNQVIWDGSQYIVVGFIRYTYTPLIITSPDAITWTQRV